MDYLVYMAINIVIGLGISITIISALFVAHDLLEEYKEKKK